MTKCIILLSIDKQQSEKETVTTICIFIAELFTIYIIYNCIPICRTAKIIAEVPEMDADDGSKLSPLKVVFPAGQGKWSEISWVEYIKKLWGSI